MEEVEGNQNDQSDEREQGTHNDDQQDEHRMFPAEKLLRLRRVQGQKQFLVKWADGSKPTWEPEEFVSERLIQEYFITHTKTGGRRKRKTCLRRP